MEPLVNFESYLMEVGGRGGGDGRGGGASTAGIGDGVPEALRAMACIRFAKKMKKISLKIFEGRREEDFGSG